MTSDRPVRIGVQVGQQHVPYAAVRDAYRRLEDLDVDVAFEGTTSSPSPVIPTGRTTRRGP